MTCCEDLDTCVGSDYILPNFVMHGLQNNMKRIASSCDCNGPFVNCLKDIKTRSAMRIYGYYVLAVPKCFKKEYPIIGCQYYDFSFNCIKYNYGDGVSHHQWFDQYISVNDDIGVLKHKTFPPKERNMVQPQQQFQHGYHHMFQSESPQQPQDITWTHPHAELITDEWKKMIKL